MGLFPERKYWSSCITALTVFGAGYFFVKYAPAFLAPRLMYLVRDYSHPMYRDIMTRLDRGRGVISDFYPPAPPKAKEKVLREGSSNAYVELSKGYYLTYLNYAPGRSAYLILPQNRENFWAGQKKPRIWIMAGGNAMLTLDWAEMVQELVSKKQLRPRPTLSKNATGRRRNKQAVSGPSPIRGVLP